MRADDLTAGTEYTYRSSLGDEQPVTFLRLHTAQIFPGRYVRRALVRFADGREGSVMAGRLSLPAGPYVPTPAQAAVLEVVDANGASFMSAQTRPSINHVHAGAAYALVNRGILRSFMGPDGAFVERVKREQ